MRKIIVILHKVKFLIIRKSEFKPSLSVFATIASEINALILTGAEWSQDLSTITLNRSCAKHGKVTAWSFIGTHLSDIYQLVLHCSHLSKAFVGAVFFFSVRLTAALRNQRLCLRKWRGNWNMQIRFMSGELILT